eukprot:g33994.t1
MSLFVLSVMGILLSIFVIVLAQWRFWALSQADAYTDFTSLVKKRRLVCLYLTVFAFCELVYFQQMTNIAQSVTAMSFSFHTVGVASLLSSFGIFVLVWFDLFDYEAKTQAQFFWIALLVNFVCLLMAFCLTVIIIHKGLETMGQDLVFRFDLAGSALMTAIICSIILTYSVKVYSTLRRTGGTSRVFLHVVLLTVLFLACGMLKLVMMVLEYLALEGRLSFVSISTAPNVWHVALSQLVPNYGLAITMLSMAKLDVPREDVIETLDQSSNASRLLRKAGLHPGESRDKAWFRVAGLDEPLLLRDVHRDFDTEDCDSSYIDGTAPASPVSEAEA